ncbi:unnamed protein product [Prunus armeniaca]
MDQCDDLIYRFKRYNADKKLNLNFLWDPPPSPEGVTKEMVEAYKGEDVNDDSSDDTDSSSEEDDVVPTLSATDASTADASIADPPNRKTDNNAEEKKKFYESGLAEGSVTCSNILNVRHSKGEQGSDHQIHAIGFFVARETLHKTQSPILNNRRLTRESKYLEDVVQRVGVLISTSTTGSVPNARENEVSPVDLRYDVLMAHNASSRISSHSPLAGPSFFLSVFVMILLMASTCPLDCGCAGDAKKMLILNQEHRCRKREQSNCLPLSVMIVFDFSGGDRSKGFDFDPLCEVVHRDDCEFELSLTLRHRANEIQSLLCERPGTDHWGERLGRQLRNQAKTLALVALLHKLDGIGVESWPIIALSNGFEG